MEPTPEQTATRRSLSDSAKIALCWCVACFLTVGLLTAADVTGGYTFTSGEKNVTHTKLNSLGAGTINATFYTDKSAQTAVGADTLLYYAAAEAAFRKTTLTTLFANAPAINGLSTLNSVGNFSVNTSKFTVNATTGTAAVEGHLTVGTNLSVTGTTTLTGTLTTTNSASIGALSAASLGVSGNSALTGTLSVGSTLTGIGAASFWNNVTLGNDAGDAITFTGTMAGTLQGTPTVSLTSVTLDASNDKVLIQDASDSSKLKIASLSGALLNTYSNQYAFDTTLKDSAHSLGDYPDMVRWAIVCTNATLGFAVGDEVDIASLVDSAKYGVWYSAGANSSNVFCAFESNTLYLRNKTNATAGVSSTAATNWNLRVRAVKKP